MSNTNTNIAKKKLIVKKDIGKTSGKEYVALVMDFGYRIEFLRVTPQFCAEALGISVPELYALENGEYLVFEDK